MDATPTPPQCHPRPACTGQPGDVCISSKLGQCNRRHYIFAASDSEQAPLRSAAQATLCYRSYSLSRGRGRSTGEAWWVEHGGRRFTTNSAR
eukprot:5984923-Alexandrium_andersonii.AAC.1